MSEIPPEYLAVARTILPFDDRYAEICYWIDKRRHGWPLHDPGWDDVRQILLIEISKVYDQFDPERGTFGQFANKVITSRISNIWRDEYSSYARPCVANGGCADNLGDNLCRVTPSGTQCSECPFYRDWEKKKGKQWAVRQTLPIDNHVNEAHNAPSNLVDLPPLQKRLHREMKKRLTPLEYKAYRLLIIKGVKEKTAAHKLGFRAKKRKKGQKKPRMYPGYSKILAFEKTFEEVARQIVSEWGLAA